MSSSEFLFKLRLYAGENFDIFFDLIKTIEVKTSIQQNI